MTDTVADRTQTVPTDADELRTRVRERYGAAATRVTSRAGQATCCGPDDDTTASTLDALASGDPITSNLYAGHETADLPIEAVLASLGCGNPTALADLHAGETVLDLGSGGGIDVLLSAKRVGPTGFAYGLDMTDEMLALAESNKQKAGAENVKFLKGTIEQIPLPDNTVDVIISNCVINLSADKGAVLREAFRVLKPGGRFAVSDIVVQGEMQPALRQSMELWAGCIAGALEETEYRRLLSAAGFDQIGLEVTRPYSASDLADDDNEDESGCCGPSAGSSQSKAFDDFTAAGGRLVSAFVRATKPTLA